MSALAYDTAEYARLRDARDAANQAYKVAAEERHSWAVVVADSVVEGDVSDYAVERYVAADAEANRLREAWFDASDAWRDLTGRPRIVRMTP